MKPHNIKKRIYKKVKDWLESLPADLAKSIKDDIIVTGGSIVSMLQDEPVNDFDIYFKTQKSALLVAKHYVEPDKDNKVFTEVIPNIRGEAEERITIYIKSQGIIESPEDDTEEDPASDEPENNQKKYTPRFISRNAITLSDKIQIITRFYGTAKEIHDSFDFVHATCYYEMATNELHLPSDALTSILTGNLVYNGSLYPVASIFRAKKFLQRGWQISAGELLKIMWQISEIDLTNMDVITEQLTGVDYAYMQALISALEEANPQEIDSTYVIGVIDKIFNTYDPE